MGSLSHYTFGVTIAVDLTC